MRVASVVGPIVVNLKNPKNLRICVFAVVVVTDGALNGPELLPAFPAETSTGLPVAMAPVSRMMPPEAPFVAAVMRAPAQLVCLNRHVYDVAPAAADARNQNVCCRSLSSRLLFRIVAQSADGGQMTVVVMLSVMTICATSTSPT